MILVQLTTTALCALAVSVNLALSVRWKRSRRECDAAMAVASRAVAELVVRCAPFLECDRCGGTVDPYRGALVHADSDAGLSVLCGTCEVAQ